MLRRNKKREETNGQDNVPISPGIPPFLRTESPALTDSNYGSSPSGSNSLYMQGSAPNSSSSNLASGRYYTEKGSHSIQPQQYAPPHHNSQQRSAGGATDAATTATTTAYPAMRGNSAYHSNSSNAQNRPMPASASIDVMGPPPQPGYHQTNNNQSSSGTTHTTSMGRSQSAFNFIISKAKGTFSSGSTNQQSQNQQHAPHPMSNPAMNASSSLSSIYSAGGNGQPSHEEQIRTDNSRTRNRAASSSSSLYAPIPPPVDRTSADMNPSGRYGVSSRPSFGDDYGMPASSPTKKSLFGRERKASNNSINRPDRGNLFGATARQAFTHSPLGRRQDSQSINSSNTVFSPFSKSQSDLHSKQDFPSPASGTIELPSVISHPTQNRAYAQNPYNTGDPNLLRSPSPNVAFSRSVDDLSRGHTPPPPPISPTAFTSHGTPAIDNEQPYNQAELNWGEHGVVANSSSDRMRASDIGTLKQEKRRGGQNVGMGLSNVPLAPSMSTSNSMNLSGWPNSGITQAGGSSRHQRKSSKTLANAQIAKPQPNLQRPAFAPGTQYDGLLNRNTQISMSVNQLSEGGGGLRGGVREKDISKGWKPYRVTLQDGKLLFFKPQSSIADDVKTLFPTSIVTESYGSHDLSSRDAIQETSRDPSLSIDGLQGLSVDDIQRNKLGTKDLLAATSGSSISSNDQPRSLPRRNATNESRLSAILDAVEPDPVTPTSSSSWERKGRHENLVLTSKRDLPETWAERISGGSVDALSHEYVFASQANGVTTIQENGVFLFAILVTLRRTSRPLQGFLVAVHKWATAITRGSSADDDDDDDSRNTKEELEKNVNSRLSFLVDAGIAQFTDDQSRSSVLLIIEDIVRDIVMFGKDDDAINARIANLRQAVQDLEIPQRSVGDNLSNETFALTTSTLLKMDPSELGRQIHAFYIDNLSKELLISKLILPLAGASDGQFIASNLLSFDCSHPHFLTTLVLEHVLGNEKEDQRERGSLQEAKERAALLRHWIAVASYLIKLQNMSAWVAICAALCSRAISRLTLTWRFVAATDRMLVSSAWAPALVNLGWSEILDAQIGSMIEATPSVKSSMSGHQNANPLYGFLPYLGNALSRFQVSSPVEAISGVMPISDSIKIAAQLWSVQEVWQSYSNSSKEFNLRPVQIKDDNIQRSLLRLCQSSKSHKTVDHNAPLRLSLKLESAWLGDDSTPAWHPAMSKSTSACALSPLSFKEPLPNLSLVDPTWIVNTIKKESKDPLAKTLLNSTNSNDSPDMDRESTITMRSRQRPTLSASPLTRSKAFGAITGTSIRPLHGVPFANIIEWTPGYQAGVDELIIRVGSDLILNVLNEVPSSIPSSPMTGKRFSQEFTRGSRPVSIASKRSSLPPSERNSLVDPIAAPIQVVVKAATLERLVDILVMDVQHLSASLASDEVLEKVILANKRSRISIDIGNYRKVFLATFRVHCKPIVLFDYLRKRLLAAINAGSEMALPLPHRPNYPTWSRVESVNSPNQQIDWEIVARIRQGVTSVLSQWINTYPQDFVEDPQLFESVDGLLKEVAIVHEKQSIQDEGDHAKLQIALKDIMRQMRLSSMTSQTEKKAAKRSSKRVSNKGNSSATNTPKLDENAKTERLAEFDIDQASAHDLVEYLESIIKVFSEKIDERDLLVVYDSFYRQSHDPLAWHVSSSQQQGTQHNPDELPPINNMYKLLELVRWPPRDSQSVYHRLPASIRDACASQSLLRGWCAVQIIEPRIGLMKRQARITKLIDAVWICRARMCNNRMEEMSSSPLSPAFVYQEPTIASFVESVLIGALTSSESRLFVRAWQQVAVERSGNCDSLASLVPPREIADKYRESSQLNSTLDVGWLLKSMAQAVLRVSDLIQEESSLIDFEKQRTIWTLIESSAGRVKSGMIDHNLVDLAGARLNVIQTTLRRVQWDRRAFKEDNAIEAASVSPVPENLRIMRGSRPLIELMIVQQDKFKRDRFAFEILSIQLEQANQRNAAQKALQSGNAGFGRQPLRSNNNNLNSPNFGPTLIPNPASANEKKTRRMTALFRGAVRPIGLMSTSGNERSTIQEIPNKSFSELLPLIPTQKPSSTVLCGSSRISIWRNGQRSFVMNFSPPEGGHILLQANNSAELQGWCTAIERASKEFSFHANHALPSQKQNLPGSTPKSSKGPTFPLYGTDLKILAESEGQSVPLALTRMMEQVEKRGLREQGIYRISGAKSAIEALKVAFNTQSAQSVNLAHGETSDVHTIAGAIKQWFRDLPEPVIPFKSYHALIDAERLENEEERLYAIRDIIWDFPRAHFELLKRVSEHLSLVCQEGRSSLMAPQNIGLVFGTSLLNPPPGPASVAESFGNIGKAAHIVKILVTMHEWLFEPEPEPEVESEVPVESPSEDKSDAIIPQGEKEIDSTNSNLKRNVITNDTDRMTNEQPVTQTHELIIDPHHDEEEEPAVTQDTDQLQKTSFDAVDEEEMEELGENEEERSEWLHNPLVTVNEGTIDSHASDSSIMRAVLGVNSSTSMQKIATGGESEDTSFQKESKEQPLLTTIPKVEIDQPESEDMSRANSTQQEFLDVQEDLSVQSTARQHTRQSSNNAIGRDRVVESVYLDATDAIAILQNPFEEEEEEGQESEIKKSDD